MSLQDQNLPDSQRAAKYLDLAYHYHTRKSDSAFYYSRRALQSANDYQLNTIKADALLQVASNYVLAANYHEALAFLSQCNELTEQTERVAFKYNTYNKISAFYSSQHAWDQAWEYARKADQIAVADRKNPDIVTAENTLAYANLYSGTKDYAKAKTLYLEALRFYQDKNDSSGMAVIYASLGQMYLEQNEVADADTALNTALKLFIQTDEPLQIASVYASMGRLFLDQNNLTLSAGYFEQAGQIYSKNHMSFAWQNQQLNDATILFQKGESYYARQKTKIAYEQFCISGNRLLQAAALRLLADIEKKVGNPVATLQYLEQYQLLSDSLEEIANPYRVKLLLAKLAADSVHNKNQRLLKSDNAVMGKETVYIISGILILLTLVLLTFMFNQKNKAIRELYNQQEQNVEKTKELEQLNSESKAKNEELARINQVKDRLLSMVAHDIRSPLNALQGTLALTQDETLTRDEFRQLTQTLDTDLFNLRNMLDNMLLWAREQVVEVKITKTNFDLSAHIAGIVKMYEHSLNAKRIQLHNFMLPGVMVHSDQEALATVVRNLLSNAIKFTPADKNIYIQYVTLSGKIYLSIKDEGIGIDPDTLQKIKSGEHFSKRGTDNEKGTGIGMMFCQELLNRMNETIDIASTPQQGTSVTVSVGTV